MAFWNKDNQSSQTLSDLIRGLQHYPYSLRVTAPTIYTHTCGKILDYMFTNMSKLYVEVDDDFHSSDHLAVFYEL